MYSSSAARVCVCVCEKVMGIPQNTGQHLATYTSIAGQLKENKKKEDERMKNKTTSLG